MKNSLAIITFLLISQAVLAQNSYNYIRNAEEVKGKRIVYTEIDIDASSELVRNKFLEFSNWSKWCKVIPKIRVLSGYINNLQAIKLDLML